MKKIIPETGEAVSETADRYLLKCRVNRRSQIMDNESMIVKNLARNKESKLPIQG
jgi:hypothetical protein